MAAARRDGRIDDPAYDAAITLLDELYAELPTIAVDEPLARHAGDLAAEHASASTTPSASPCALAIDARTSCSLPGTPRSATPPTRPAGRLLVHQR